MKRYLVPILMAAATVALADGGILPPDPYYIREDVQTAYLDWDAGRGREQLTIHPGFRGNARDFTWLVPLPAPPQMAVGERSFLPSLRAATDPVWRDRDEGWSCSRNPYHPEAEAGGTIDIVSNQVIDAYHVLVVQASDAGVLTDSLLAWGHLNATNAGIVEPVLADYVDEGWSFVAARVDSTAFANSYPSTHPGYVYRGSLRPLVFGFDTERPVYPMRISRVSADPRTWVELYVEADHRYEHPLLDAVYANRFSTEELEELRSGFPVAATNLATGRFLTRLQGELDPGDMDADLYPRRAGDDREFRSIRYSGWPVTGLVFGGALLGWAVRRWRRRRT